MVYALLIVGAVPAGISTAVEARVAGIEAVYKGIPAVSEGKISITDGSKQQTLDFLGEIISCPIPPPLKA